MVGSPAVWETLCWVSHCHYVFASRWLKISPVPKSSLKEWERPSSLPCRWNCRLNVWVSLISLTRLTSSPGSLVISPSHLRLHQFQLWFNLSCQGTGSCEKGLSQGSSAAQACLPPADAAASGGWGGRGSQDFRVTESWLKFWTRTTRLRALFSAKTGPARSARSFLRVGRGSVDLRCAGKMSFFFFFPSS